MIAVHYFASIREALGREHENLELPGGVSTVDELIDHLVSLNGGQWAAVLGDSSVMVAINHTMTNRAAPVNSGDEVAFFPPVTGG